MRMLAATADCFEAASEHGPPAWSPSERAWIVTRYADVAAVLRDPSLRVVDMHQRITRLGAGAGRDYSSLSNLLGTTLFYRNAPFHTEARQLLMRTMSELRGQFSEPVLRDLVASIVASAERRGRVEAMTEICVRLPLEVMCRALGLSPATGTAVVASGARIIDSWKRALPLRKLDELQAEASAIERMIARDIAGARGSGSGGILTLLELNSAGPRLSHREIAGLAFFLVFAAVETTSAYMASALYLILAHPAVSARIRNHAASIAPALEEVLRLACPVRRMNARVAPEGFQLAGLKFREGELLIAELGQAHRDPAAFPDPLRFDIDRRGPPSLGFGAGPHACLGAALAKLETRLLIERMMTCTRVELASRPAWETHTGVTRLERLDLLLTPAG